ncbi:MAG: hypothetical protein KDK97_00530 [Verrucomicrobiales bacterium]|nr:hypothetical protein [Verrucomicrobiales bacterium]MCP5559746.1 hypothetical protein [Verrucomicrobiaceae bacterium]
MIRCLRYGAAALLWMASPVQLRAADEPTKEEAATLPDDVQKSLREFVGKVAKSRRELWADAMKSVCADIAKAHGLSADQTLALEAGVPAVIEVSMKEWEEKCFKWLTPYIERSQDAARDISRWSPKDIATAANVEGVQPPSDLPEWETAVKSVLPDAEFIKWQAALVASRKQLADDITEYLNRSEEQVRVPLDQMMDVELADMTVLLNLDEGRLNALKAAGKAAVTSAMTDWKRRASDMLTRMDATRRDMLMTREAGIYVDTNKEENLPRGRPEWKEAVKKILTPEDNKRLTDARDGRREHRFEAIARIAIAELDKRVGFTSAQRVQLEPLMEAAMKKLPDRLVDYDERYYYNLDLKQIFKTAEGLDDEALKVVLDTKQLDRWRSVVKDPNAGDEEAPPNAEIVEGAPADPVPQDEMDLERTISGHLYFLAESQRVRLLQGMQVKVEELERVVKPAPEVLANLQTAAKGAVERALSTWRGEVERWVRQSVQGARPQDIQKRLMSMGSYYGDRNLTPVDQTLWKSAIDHGLTEAQRAAWKVETDAREGYQGDAIVGLVVSEAERRLRLGPDQTKQLQPKVSAIIKEYGPDIARYFSSPWYLQSYSVLIPLAGVPEAEMKTVLQEGQLDVWKEREFNRINSYWSNIEQNRKRK